jgi:hypothetical protein
MVVDNRQPYGRSTYRRSDRSESRSTERREDSPRSEQRNSCFQVMASDVVVSMNPTLAMVVAKILLNSNSSNSAVIAMAHQIRNGVNEHFPIDRDDGEDY